jgi:hypothetical protein
VFPPIIEHSILGDEELLRRLVDQVNSVLHHGDEEATYVAHRSLKSVYGLKVIFELLV